MVNIFNGHTDTSRGPRGVKGTKGDPGEFPSLQDNGGFKITNSKIGLSPLVRLWSGIAMNGTSFKLKESPEKFRVLFLTANRELGRYLVESFLPAAFRPEVETWYVYIGQHIVLTFTGEKHQNVEITGIGELQYGLDSIYGQD
jgi:hypothetical protein